MSADLTAMQLHEASQLANSGWSQKTLATRYGVSPAKLCRLLARYRETGGDAEAAVAKAYATGPRDDESSGLHR